MPKQNNFRNSCFFSKERGCVNGIFGYIGVGYCDDENNNTTHYRKWFTKVSEHQIILYLFTKVCVAELIQSKRK